jgi:hypothetical protein
MIPETASNKTMELYRAVRFPDQWEFAQTLMKGEILLDCSLFFHDETWWLFANRANHPFASTNDQLLLYYNEDLFSGEWKLHPQSPVATHTENCRPAGRIFSYNNKLYRPAQNNASSQYGYGLKINEIQLLDKNRYKEKEILSILPETFGLKALHHIDFSGSLVFIDGIPGRPHK